MHLQIKILQGKIRNALNYISYEQTGSSLSQYDIIQESQGLTIMMCYWKTSISEAQLSNIPETVNPIIYSNLDAECISNAALHIHGAAGLSVLEEIVFLIKICFSIPVSCPCSNGPENLHLHHPSR